LVAKNIFAKIDTDSLRMLHFAPEAFFRTMFSRMFAVYETADIDMENVDHCVDLQELPFSSATYDVVWASHVLEHVKDDLAAVREIRRILKPGGIAVLPVPLVVSATIEYPEPNVNESKHVRAPGPDYYDRFREHFSRVDLFSSSAFPEKHQVYIHENRLDLPNSLSPFRTAMTGSRHLDIVPVCYV
jgi:SAM-dependent methyltransferase